MLPKLKNAEFFVSLSHQSSRLYHFHHQHHEESIKETSKIIKTITLITQTK